MKQNFLAACVLALGLVVAGFLGSEGIKFLKRFERSVEVKGLAERIVKSTDATWRLEFVVAADTMPALNEESTRVQREIMDFLLRKGFEADEIQRNPTNIRDKEADPYSPAKSGPRFTGRGSFVVGTKKVDAVTKTVEQTDELNIKSVLLERSTASYYFTDLNRIKPEMLKEATAAAFEAASSFAVNSNSRLGEIRSATQGLFSIEAPLAEFEAASSINKKVRVVTQVSYFIR